MKEQSNQDLSFSATCLFFTSRPQVERLLLKIYLYLQVQFSQVLVLNTIFNSYSKLSTTPSMAQIPTKSNFLTSFSLTTGLVLTLIY